jgi:CBS domain containing-hemolysin-like protein
MSLLLASLLLIGVNALLVLMEFALVKVRGSRIEVLERKCSSRALKVQQILASLDNYLAAIQVGITVIALALGWIGEPAIAALIQRAVIRMGLNIPPEFLHAAAFGAALVLLSCLHIILGELVPRSIGIQKAEIVALWGAYPLQLVTKVISSCLLAPPRCCAYLG